MTKIHKIVISIIIATILFGTYIYFDRKSKEQNQPTNTNISTSTGETATTTISGTQIKTKGSGGYTIEQVSVNKEKEVPQPIPDLNRVSVTSKGAMVTPEAKASADLKIKSLQVGLQKNTRDFNSWLELGSYQKLAGDYEGAVISWQYAGKLLPMSYIPFGNLGDLYAYYLKDNGQAEIYYKEALKKGPTQSYLYTQLAEVYRDLFRDLNKARAIVEEGLSKIPNDPNLLELKASLQ